MMKHKDQHLGCMETPISERFRFRNARKRIGNAFLYKWNSETPRKRVSSKPETSFLQKDSSEKGLLETGTAAIGERGGKRD